MKKSNIVILALVMVLALVVSVNAAEPTVVAVKGDSFVNHGGPEDYKVPTIKDETRSDYTGFFVGWDTAGTWIEWEIDVPTAGDYVFVVRYATHNTSDVKRSFSIRLADGEPYAAIDVIDFPKGGGYGREEWLVKIVEPTVTLKAGKNVVRLESLPTDQEYTGMNIVNFGFIAADQLPLDADKVIELVDTVLY